MLKRRLKEPFGKAGLIVAVLALVLALVGGAYAAGGLTKSQEKQVTKIAKKYAGKPGAPGTNGTPGAPGPAGPAGTKGANGTNGESVTVTESANAFAGGNCNGTTKGGKGGSEFKVGASTTYACNGKEGHEGPAGPEGNIKATLPPEATETGAWSYGGGTEDVVVAPASFAIPLAKAIPASEVHFVTESEWSHHTAPAACPGNPSKPEATAGAFCAYAGSSSGKVSTPNAIIQEPAGAAFPSEGAATSGAVLFFGEAEEESFGFGTWAVTAPEG